MEENANSKWSQCVRRAAIAIAAIGIAAAPAVHSKSNSKKTAATPANVVAHVGLSGGQVTQMWLVKKNRKEYLVLGLDSSPCVEIVDVSEPSQPRTVDTTAEGAGAPATELRIVADTLTLFGKSDAKAAASVEPKEIRSLSGVTSFVKDRVYGLIYVTNRDGLWILKTSQRADDDAQFYGNPG
jgi:hypothetical protein